MKPAALLIAILALLVQPLRAQEAQVIEEDLFWAMLLETQASLTRYIDALSAEGSRTFPEAVNELWRNVDGVQLADGKIIEVNVSWLIFEQGASRAELEQTQIYVEALLRFHQTELEANANSEEALKQLQELMQKFQYNQEPPQTEPRAPTPPVAPGFFEILLIVLAVVVVVIVLGYFLHNLQLQPAALLGESDSDELPTTSEKADDLAAQSHKLQDYRAAIRYLYLSSLLSLDERGVIHYDPTLTNIEHLRQLRDKPNLRDLLGYIVDVFDQVWYGFAPVDDALFQQFQTRVNQLKQVQ